MRNPKQTIAYLDELLTLGFTDEAFWKIHHFQEKGENHPINTHRTYCEKTDSFQDGGNNERVQMRLEIVLKYFKAYHAGNPAAFPRLADAAYVLIPPDSISAAS
jgi:hypothetical protein